MITFKVFHQLPPKKDKLGNWFSVLFPVGEVEAVNSHGALAVAKQTFKIRFPILKKI